jgi:hypothetical protein
MLHVSVCLVALLETLSQEAHRATFHCHCNTPRRISSEAAPDVVRTEPLGVSPGEDEASYGSDCNAAAADDDEDEASYDSDGGLQYYMRGIVGHAMRARLTAKFKLLQDVEGLLDEAMRARLAGKFKLLHDRRLVVKDKLRRRASAPGLVVKRIANVRIYNSKLETPKCRIFFLFLFFLPKSQQIKIDNATSSGARREWLLRPLLPDTLVVNTHA